MVVSMRVIKTTRTVVGIFDPRWVLAQAFIVSCPLISGPTVRPVEMPIIMGTTQQRTMQKNTFLLVMMSE